MNQIMQWNLNIDFNKKNNQKPKTWRWTTYNRRPAVRRNEPKLSSKAFLSHLDNKQTEIENPKKLIKKWEKPVKIGSLLWLEQVGQCMYMEYDKDIVLVDAGMEFAANEQLWADYIIPDISYIKKNKHKLRWIVITHWHLDHVWWLRHILPDLGFPTIYTTPLTLGIIKKTFDDPKEAAKIKYKIVDPDTDIIKLWVFTFEFVSVNHNIPESMALSIHTPKWIVFNSGDFKIDHTPAIDKPADLNKIARIWLEWVKLYIWDSLWTKKAGWSVSEKTIAKNLDDLIKGTKWRIFMATFASNIGRIIQVINSAIKYNRVVFLSGRSMVNNVEICQELWYLTIPKWYVRKLDDQVNTLPDERVLVLSTWAQGEEFASLTRIAKNEHPIVQLKKGDTVLMSSTAIPGNELSVKSMIDALVIKEVNLITNDDMDIHASGHGNIEDHKLFLSLLKPEFFLPYYMAAAERYDHKKIWLDMWIAESRILMPHQNWHIIEMYDDVVMVSDNKIKLDTILVDGKWQWHLSGEYVIKARNIMAESWVISLIFKIDTKSKELIGNIQIESRWFVYSSEVRNIHTQIVEFARAKYNENVKKRMDVKDNLKQIKEDLSEFIVKIIDRVPMIVPMYVYINRDPKWNGDMTQEEAIVGMTLEEQWYDH